MLICLRLSKECGMQVVDAVTMCVLVEELARANGRFLWAT